MHAWKHVSRSIVVTYVFAVETLQTIYMTMLQRPAQSPLHAERSVELPGD